MTKKQLMIIIITMLILLVASRLIMNNKKEINTTISNIEVAQLQSKFDADRGLYYLQDESTGEIIAASRDESDLQFYLNHPDYNPDPLTPKSKNLEDFVALGENLDMAEEY